MLLTSKSCSAETLLSSNASLAKLAGIGSSELMQSDGAQGDSLGGDCDRSVLHSRKITPGYNQESRTINLSPFLVARFSRNRDRGRGGMEIHEPTCCTLMSGEENERGKLGNVNFEFLILLSLCISFSLSIPSRYYIVHVSRGSRLEC